MIDLGGESSSRFFTNRSRPVVPSRVDSNATRVPSGEKTAVAALPKVNGNGTTHHRALPHGEVPDALRRIRSANAPESARLAVELIVLTAARSGEARAATWDEIDTAAKVWTIPPARMKAGREHRVPLSSGALDVLLRASELAGDSPFVFPTRAGRALSSKSTFRVLQLAGVTGTTLHGFRT